MTICHATINQKDSIKSIEMLNSDEYSKIDVIAITDKKEEINIEIQIKNENNIIKKTLYDCGEMFINQIKQGQNYRKLNRTVCINILDFNYLESNKFHNIYRLKETSTNEELTDIQEIHFIELPKIKNLNQNKDITNTFELWMEFIKNPSSKLIEQSEKEIKEAKEELVRLSNDEKERKDIAISLLKQGFDIDIIVKTTNISIEKIKELEKNIK